MKEVKIYFTGNKELKLLLNDIEIMTLKEWIINESLTLSIKIESDKSEITLFRPHITYIQYN
jgi:hypothetical protein